MPEHRVGTRQEWLAGRLELLDREKELTRLGDELARQRRELPWVRVEKDYVFDMPGSDELPGLSAFALEDGVGYYTYSTYGRGLDIIDNVYQLLDRAPKGRDEGDGRPDDWIRRHDEYEDAAAG